MATLLHSESRRLYSWWWDSHISPKNSKWLQENLTDMDTKVKSMIKLIEEDADSFARRAEMYYKKRPELMKLVEEFYRAYRALAERYNHATVELRHAHKTISEAFPDQLPFDMNDDSASASSEPRTPEMPPKTRPVFDSEDLQKDGSGISRRNSGCSGESHGGMNKRGLKQLNELLGSHGKKVETEVEASKKTLAELQAEKEALHCQYQLSLQKLSSLEKELNNAQKDAGGLNERAGKAEVEIQILKEALAKLEAERDAGLLQYNQSKAKISNLEALISQGQEDAKELNIRASKAEVEAQHLKEEISRLRTEKEAGFLQYMQCLKVITALENKIKAVEESAQIFHEQTERAETEVEALKQELLKLNAEKEEASLQCQKCLETIAKLESEISCAQEDAERLSSQIQAGAEKLKMVEGQCAFWECSNQSLQLEADNLAQKIAIKDHKLLEKQNELEKLQTLLQEEYSRFAQLEASLKKLQNLHSQSQEAQTALTLKLQNKLQMLRDLEIRNHELEDEISEANEENRTLTELSNSSSVSLQIRQNEISTLKEMKEKLEEEVARQVDQSNVLQEEVFRLKEEIDDLNRRYQILMEQVKLAGLDPECIVSSVKKLQDENSKLIALCNNQRDEKNALSEKLKEVDDILREKALLESSLLESNTKLEGSREKVKDFQERCESFRGEKSDLIAERVNLLSQLQIMTQNMQKLLEKNTLLENSLSGANIELEGLRAKSKCFEEFFQLLKNEKSDLLNERESLVSQLNRVEERLGILETRFLTLEGKYADLEKEKQFTHFQVEELRVSLIAEKQERATYVQSSEFRLADLQNHVSLLRDECRSRKKEFEEELDRAVNAQIEIFILQKFIEDLESKNFALLIECQKYVEASKFSEKVLSELESENLEQQMEAEFLLDEIENLRDGIYQVFKALQFSPDHKYSNNKIEKEKISIPHILSEVDDLKCSLSSKEDDKQRLVVENSVLLSLLGQFRLDGLELETEKNIVGKNLDIMMKQYEMLQKEKYELMEINEQLKSEVINGDGMEKVLRTELETERVKLGSLQDAYLVLQREYSNELEKNKSLLKKFSELKDEVYLLEEENGVILREAVALSNMSLVYQCFRSEKEEEVEAFAENLNSLQEINNSLKQKVEKMEEQLNVKEAERQEFDRKLEKLHKDFFETNEMNAQLKHQILAGDEILRKKANDLVEAEHLLKATNNMNAELCKGVEELKKECEESKLIRETLEKQVSELFEFAGKQKEEIERLHGLNGNLETEVELLHKEIQEQVVREEYLSLELQEKSNEFGLWDAEATSFYFDLQISAVHEVLLENKVHELTGVCENLRDESAVKSMEIERMKEKVGSLESEIGELKTQLSAYDPVVASLRNDVNSLEQSAVSFTKLSMGTHQHEEHEDEQQAMVPQEHEENRSAVATNGISYLQEMLTRIRAIQRAMLEERDRLATHKSSVICGERRSSSDKSIDPKKEEEIVEGKSSVVTNMVASGIRQQKTKPRLSEVKLGLLMKDIPLDQVSDSSSYGRSREGSRGSNDQMLELWQESVVQDSTMKSIIKGTMKKTGNRPCLRRKSRDRSLESQIERELGVVDKLELSRSIEDKAKIWERLVSDAKKLRSLQTSVRELKMKMEMSERNGRTHNPDFVKVKKQLKEMEEAILQLVNTNETLSKEIEETGDGRDIYRKIIAEKSRNGSEKIEQLQFDVQNIELVVLKLEDGAKIRGKKKFSESRTVILLRDIIHKGGKRTGRRKKNRFCGCMRSSTKEE